MSNFIEEFYFGNLEPQECKTHVTTQLKGKLSKLTEIEERLRSTLSDESEDLLDYYCKAYNEFLCVSCSDSFENVFRLGARFTYDTFVGDKFSVICIT